MPLLNTHLIDNERIILTTLGIYTYVTTNIGLFWRHYLPCSTQCFGLFLLLRLLIFQEEIDRKEKTHLGEYKGHNKEQTPPFMHSDMLPVL